MYTFASVFLGFFMNVAKLFTHGGSQAVRLPKEFRFEGTEVHVRRVGNEVVLSAQPPADLQTLLDALEGFEAGVRLRREQPAAQSRAAIKPRR
jgi:antitoxin VapB